MWKKLLLKFHIKEFLTIMATALETSLANLTASQNALTAAINRIVSCCSQTTPQPTTPPVTPAPTSAPTPPNCTYTATLDEQQTTNCYSITLPKGFINVTVMNEDPSDGFVIVQSDDGNGRVIYIKTTVAKDAQIYGVASYEAKTGGKININP